METRQLQLTSVSRRAIAAGAPITMARKARLVLSPADKVMQDPRKHTSMSSKWSAASTYTLSAGDQGFPRFLLTSLGGIPGKIWAVQGLNLRPLACRASALPLS